MLPTVTRYQKYTRVTSYKAPLVYFLVNIFPFPPALTMSISVPLNTYFLFYKGLNFITSRDLEGLS